MQGSLNFEGKKYISAKDAAKQFGYTSDYIGQLCRGGKIKSKLVGRVWYVLESEISSYKKVHLAPGRPSKKNLSNKKTLHSSSFKKTKKIADSKEDVLLENKKEIYLNLETPKESPKYNVFPEISRVAEIDSKKVLYIEDNSELFPTLKRNIDLEYIKRHAFDNLEKAKSGKYKATKFDKTVASSLVAVVVLSLGTFGLFEGSNFINRLKTESRGSAFEEVSLLYSPLVRDINRSVAQISEKTGVSSSQLALSVASDSNTKLVFDFVRNIGEKVFGRFFGKETVLVDSGESNTVKTIVIKETSYPSAAPAQNTVSTQAKTVFLPSFDKEYINSLIEEKFVALKNNFLTSTIAPNVNRYYVSRQNDEIVGNIGSVVANLEDRIDDAISNISLTDLNLSTLSVSGTSIFSGNVSLNGSTTASTLSATDWLSVGTTTNHATLTVDGAFYLAQVTPPGDTSNRLYNDGGDLYWNGSILAGSGVGNWSTDGTSVWRASGKVGIGTSTPSTALVVQGNGLTYVNTNTNAGSSTISFGGGNNNRPVFNMGPLGTPDEFKIWNLGYYQMGATNSQGLALMTNNTNRLYITSAGNVGIGTTSPGSLLQIEGNPSGAILTLRRASTAGDLPIYFTKSNGGLQGAIVSYNAGDISLHTTDGAEKVRLLNNGNLGIGTTSPFAKLSVESTAGAAQFAIGSSTATSFIVDKNGNVGIGIVTPTQALDVVGSVQASGSFYSGNGIGISPTQTTMYSGYNFGWNANATRAGSPDVNLSRGGVSKLYLGNGTLGDFTGTLIAGNIGVATTSPSAKLSIKADGTGTGRAFTISDSADAEKLTVLDNGSLLLGTGSQLASSGKIRLTLGDGIRWRRNDLVNDMGITYDASGSFWYGTASSSSAPFLINSSGNIGVGISSPTSLLTLYGASQTITLQNPTTGSTVSDGYYLGLGAGTTDMYLWNRESGAVYFGQNNGTVMTLNNGNVGIGTTTPVTKLTVYGTSADASALLDNGIFTVRGSNGAYLQIGSQTGEPYGLYLQGKDRTNNGTTYPILLNPVGGNVGVGTTTPWGKLSITNTGSGPSFIVEDSTSPDASPFVIDASGNVGVGTVVADNKLHIVDTLASNLRYGLKLSNSADGVGAATGILFEVQGGAAGRGKGGLIYQNDTSLGWNRGDFMFLQNSTADATNPTASNAVLTIKNNGNVGIGSTSPFAKLSVESTAGASQFVVGSSTATQFIVDKNGNVGVGTANPTSLLQIYGQGVDILQVGNGVDTNTSLNVQNRALFGYNQTRAAATIQGISGRGIDFNVNNNTFGSGQAMVITSAGNVGVGTTSPLGLLSVNANGLASGAPQFVVGSSTATNLIVANDGNVGVGMTSPSYKLDVNGDIRYGANGTLRINGAGNFKLDSDELFFGGGSLGTIKTNWGGGGLSLIAGGNNQTSGDISLITNTASGDVTRLIIKSDGNVGIGTTSPYAKLSVVGDAAITGNVRVAGLTATGTVTFSGITGSDQCLQVDANGVVAGTGSACGSSSGGSAGGTWATTTSQVAGRFVNYSLNSTDLVAIGSNSTTTAEFWFDPNTSTSYLSGNVGIGVTSPGNKLHITGGGISIGNNAALTDRGLISVHDSSDARINITKAGVDGYRLETNGTAGSSYFTIGRDNGSSDTGSTNAFLNITQAGNVGVGSTTPMDKLTVVGGDISLSRNQYIRFRSESSSIQSAAIGGTSSNDLAFYTNGLAEGMRLTSSGYLGIASTSPWGLLSVNPNGLSSGAPQFVVGSSTATNFIIANNGNVGVGITNPTAKLDVNGSIYLRTGSFFSDTYSGYSGGAVTHNIPSSSYLRFVMGSPTSSFQIQDSSAVPLLKMEANGRLGLGSSTPWAQLSVHRNTSDTSYSPLFAIASSTASGTTTNFIVANNGNVGIGTTNLTDNLTLKPSSAGKGMVVRESDDGNEAIRLLGFSGGGNLSLQTGGVNTISFDATSASGISYFNAGNVGIGTTTPNRKLTVFSDSTVGQSQLRLGFSDQFSWDIGRDNGSSDGRLMFTSNHNGTTAERMSILSNTGNVGIGTTSPWGLLSVNANGLSSGVPQFVVGSSTATNFIVANGGNVGIGTAEPTEKLSVNGNIQIPSGSAIRLSSLAGSPQIFSSGSTNISISPASNGTVVLGSVAGIKAGVGTTTPFGALAVNSIAGVPGFTVGSSTGTYFIVDKNGNVGVGTTSPFSHFEVQGSGIYDAYNTITASGGNQAALYIRRVQSGGSYNNGWTWYIPASSKDLRLYGDAGGDLLTVQSTTGNVGIGTTSPSSALHVSNSSANPLLTFERPGVSTVNFGNSGSVWTWSSSAASANHFAFAPAGVEAMRIQNGGNVGIGTTAPGDKLEVSGNVFASAFNSTSTVSRYNSIGGVFMAGNGGSSYAEIRAYSDVAGTGKILSLNSNGGNVGIGTTSPTNTLAISGIGLDINRDGAEPNVVFRSTGAQVSQIRGLVGGGLRFTNGNSSSEWAKIDSSGNFGVGSSTPWGLLSVNANGLSSGAPQFVVGSSTATNFIVANGGNVGVGLLSPSSRLDVQGVAGATNIFRVASSTGSDLLTVDKAGNVWIGTTVVEQRTLTLQATDPVFYLKSYGGSSAQIKYDGGSTFTLTDGTTNILQFNNSGSGNDIDIVARNSSDSDIGFNTGNGQRRMTVKYDGNVGIGTTTPQTKLVIYDTDYATNNRANLEIMTSSSQAAGVGGSIAFGGRNDQGTSPSNSPYIFGKIEGISEGSTGWAGALAFSTTEGSSGITEKLRITSAGYTGVGSSTPWGLLSVNANGLSSGAPQFVVGSSTATNFIVANNGNVGVGTASPSHKLTLASGNFAVETGNMYLASGNSIHFDYGSSNSYYIQKNGTNLYLGTGGSFAMMNGNVGVGTTTPGDLLTLSSLNPRIDLWANTSTSTRVALTSYGNLGFATLQTRGAFGLRLGTNSGEHLNIDTSGNVGIGTSSPTYLLNVVGATGGVSGITTQNTSASSYGMLNVFNKGAKGLNVYALGSTYGNTFFGGVTGNNQLVLEANSGTSSFYVGTNGSQPIILAPNRTAAVTIINGGNVGIGTTTPNYKLTLTDSSASQLSLSAGAGIGQWAFRNAGGNLYFSTTTVAGTATSTLAALSINGSNGALSLGTTTAGTLRVTSGGVVWADTSGGNAASSTLLSDLNTWSARQNFNGNASTTGLTVTGSTYLATAGGNVGIGTTTPQYNFVVSASSDYKGIWFENSNSIGSGMVLNSTATGGRRYSITSTANGAGAGGGLFNIFDETAALSRLSINSSGNVGIGTTTPSAKFDIYSSTDGITSLRVDHSGGKWGSDSPFLSFNYSGGTALSNFYTENGNQLVFDHSGSDMWLFTDSNRNLSLQKDGGNVGIGTTTPSSKLSIQNTNDANENVGIQLSTLNNTNGAGQTISFAFNDTIGSTPNGAALAVVKNASGKDFIFRTSNGNAAADEKLRITGTGNVGIGTTSPTSRLQVAGSSIGVGNETGILSVVDSADNSRRLLFGIDNTLGTNGTAFISGVKQGVAWLPLLLNPSGGNVGIGTTTPSSLFTVHGSGLPQILVNGTAGDSRIQLANLGIASAQIAYDNSSGRGLNISTLSTAGQKNLFLQTSGVDRVTIDSVGNVGIGTTTPWGLLSVNANGLSSGAPQFVVGSSTATNFIVANNGNVGVGTTTPGYKLDVNGDAYFTNSGGAGHLFLGKGTSVNHTWLGTRSNSDWALMRDSSEIIRFTGAYTLYNGTASFAGNVGIGTTTPAATLTVTKSGATGNIFAIASSSGENYFTVAQHGSYGSTSQVTVKGVASFNNDFDQAATVALKNTNSGTNVAAGYTVSAGADFTNLGIFTAYSTAYDNPPGYERAGRVFMGHSIGSGGLTLIGGSDIRFNVGGTSLAEERMRLTSDGKLGIGTTSPTNALGVVGSIDTTSTYRINNTIRMLASTNYTELADGSGNSRLHLGNATDPTNYYSNNTHVFRNGAASTEYGRFTSSGYLGVGTSTPWAQLSIHRNTSNTSNAPLFVVASSTASATTTNFIVTSNGNVGIGTSAPGFPLHVNGNAMIGATVPTYIPTAPLNLVNSAGGVMKTQLSLVNTGGGGGAGSAIDFYTYDLSGGTNPGLRMAAYDNNYSADFAILTKVPGNEGNAITEKFRLTNTGLVGIGTTSPIATLSVQGTSTATTIDPFVVASSSGSTMFRIDRRGNMLQGSGTLSSGIINSMAIGGGSVTAGAGNFDNSAIGYGASITQGYRNLAMHGATITGNSSYSIAIGTGASIPNDGTSYAIAIGTGDTSGSVSTAIAGATNSVAIGNYITTSATGAYIFGSGPTGASRLVNNVANSIMLGTNTTAPTLFVGPGRTTTTAGTVAVGTTTTSATFALQGASGFDILSVATSTSGRILTISSWGGFVQNISSSTAIDIQNGNGQSVFAVDTTGTAANSGIDITAGGSQTGNLVNLYSSGGTYLSGFTASGAMLMNISSTTAIDIQNGSNVSVFSVDTTNKWIKIATTTSPTFTADGQFTIGNSGTAASGGRIWIRSGATTFRFQSDNNTADYSEFFYQFEGSEAGDVLSLATKEYIEENANASTTLPKDTGVVRRTSGGYDERIAGVYTERGTSFNNPNDDRQNNPNFANVGLLGHVLTKVTDENGEIMPGDYITSSEKFPGYGMKATKSGQIVGVALKDSNNSTTTEVVLGSKTYKLSKVMVMVSPRYQAITENVLVEVNNGETLSGDEIQNQTPLVLHNQNDSGPIMQLQAAGQTRLLVANNGAVKMFTQETDSKGIVFEINNNGGSAFSINSAGDVKVAGTIYIESDSFAGSIATNDMGLADIDFANNLGTGKPVIQLTPEGDVPTIAQVASWKKDLAGNYIGLVIKTFGTEGQAVTANVHYAVFGKREGYETTNGIPILTNTTDPDQEEPELVLPEGDGVTGGNATTTASSTPDGDNATSTPDGSGDVGDGATTTPTSG